MRSVKVIEDRVRHSLFCRLGLSAAASVGLSLPPATSDSAQGVVVEIGRRITTDWSSRVLH